MANFFLKIGFSVINTCKARRETVQLVSLYHTARKSTFCGKIGVPVTFQHNLTFNTQNRVLSGSRSITTDSHGIQDNISALQLKKRLIRKKKILEDELSRPPGLYSVAAFATAEEYDLEALIKGLKELDLYEPKVIKNTSDVVHAVAKYQVESEPREIFFFREGSVVLWNVTDLESSNVLKFLRQYESDSYSERLVQQENELMNYRHQAEGLPSALDKDGDLLVATADSTEITLDKYTYSNAMTLSVKLAIWEASLERYIDTIEFVTEDLKRGNKIKMSQEEVLRKHGELFALRHLINLSSDLLDTPDFYWENEQLESLYNQVCNYFAIARRTKVSWKRDMCIK
jgi:uncharacterized Rmd1/YagE family protein